MDDSTTEDAETAGSWTFSLVVSVLILAAAGGVAALTFFTEPSAEKGGATKKTAMLVDVREVDRGNYRPSIVAQGTVAPAREIALRPQIEGRVTSIAAEFTPGGHVEEGDRLLKIESADYRHALAQRKSELREAKSNLAIEKGRHEAAKAEYERFGEELPEDKKARVLRKPQLEAAREKVEAARAAVEQAELNLRRTTLEAPFDGHVLERDVNVGSQISPGENIGRLVGTAEYWVEIDLPLSKLRWVSIREGEAEGSEVRLRNRQAWPAGVHRTGHLSQKIGALDEDARMARILATVSDPLAQNSDGEGKPPLTIGEFLRARIEGKELEDVVRLDRDYVRDDETVWTMENGKLQVHDIEIALQDAEYAYVTKGLEDGARVVTTNLSTVTEGAPLRLKSSGEETSGE